MRCYIRRKNVIWNNKYKWESHLYWGFRFIGYNKTKARPTITKYGTAKLMMLSQSQVQTIKGKRKQWPITNIQNRPHVGVFILFEFVCAARVCGRSYTHTKSMFRK